MPKKISPITIADLIPDDRNANIHSEKGMSLLRKGLQENGMGRSILISADNKIIAGNGVTEGAGAIGIEKLKIIDTDGSEIIAVRRNDIKSGTKEFYQMALSDNIIAQENIVMDADVVEAICEEYDIEDWDVEKGTGGEKEAHKKLTESFMVPPFSILDSRKGYWKERKGYWKTLIKDNGETRIDVLGKDAMLSEINNGTSILDPVLAELVNLWFGLPGGTSFDCFAGDSVFGYVSAFTGHHFTGIELRKEQADINTQRVEGLSAKYICDDGKNVLKHIEPGTQDLLFSCPPYFDLEVYSDLENDASNQKEYSDFLKILKDAFTDAVKCLKNNRFAVITVGDIRDKKGFYRRFNDDIKDIFIAAGLQLYNELILIESLGTLPQRANRLMINRKIGKCHQNVLVFFKGDPKQIKDIYPKLTIEIAADDESTDV